jgi:hypothetical protein
MLMSRLRQPDVELKEALAPAQPRDVVQRLPHDRAVGGERHVRAVWQSHKAGLIAG